MHPLVACHPCLLVGFLPLLERIIPGAHLVLLVAECPISTPRIMALANTLANRAIMQATRAIRDTRASNDTRAIRHSRDRTVVNKIGAMVEEATEEQDIAVVEVEVNPGISTVVIAAVVGVGEVMGGIEKTQGPDCQLSAPSLTGSLNAHMK